MKRIAIIGSGISGLGAAYALKDSADITVFEADDRAGGHAHTMTIEHDGKPTSVDVGFIVYNGHNYPNLTGFFEALGVPTEASDMSFSVSNPNGYEWASTLKGIFAQKRNLLNPRFHKFWRTIFRFNDVARSELHDGKISDISLGSWLDQHKFDQDFLDNYILPMGGAIWSTPEAEMLNYPALSFFKFFDNHRLMHKERPSWRTVTSGSKSYVEKMVSALGPRLKLNAPIASIDPYGDKVRVTQENGQVDVFDDVILATHSDISLKLLSDRYEQHQFMLRSVRYRPNDIYLHKDPALMPRRKAAWASWNVMKTDQPDICLTYWMNRLQNFKDQSPLFVTLNPETAPDPAMTYARMSKSHPLFDAAALAAVRTLKTFQGHKHIWLAGAWMGSGFHEDGLKAGLSCGLSLGGSVPWVAENVDHVDPTIRATGSDAQDLERANLG